MSGPDNLVKNSGNQSWSPGFQISPKIGLSLLLSVTLILLIFSPSVLPPPHLQDWYHCNLFNVLYAFLLYPNLLFYDGVRMTYLKTQRWSHQPLWNDLLASHNTWILASCSQRELYIHTSSGSCLSLWPHPVHTPSLTLCAKYSDPLSGP